MPNGDGWKETFKFFVKELTEVYLPQLKEIWDLVLPVSPLGGEPEKALEEVPKPVPAPLPTAPYMGPPLAEEMQRGWTDWLSGNVPHPFETPDWEDIQYPTWPMGENYPWWKFEKGRLHYGEEIPMGVPGVPQGQYMPLPPPLLESYYHPWNWWPGQEGPAPPPWGVPTPKSRVRPAAEVLKEMTKEKK